MRPASPPRSSSIEQVSAKRRNDLLREQLEMILGLTWRQSRRLGPRVVVRYRNRTDEVADHSDRPFRLNNFEQTALAQSLAILQMNGIG